MSVSDFSWLQQLKQIRLAKERGDLIEDYLSTYPRIEQDYVRLTIKQYIKEERAEYPTTSQFSSFLLAVATKYPDAEVIDVADPRITDESDDDIEGRFSAFEMWIRVPPKPEDIEYDKNYEKSLIEKERDRKKALYLSLKKEFEKDRECQ
jgi:hypothetical protein